LYYSLFELVTHNLVMFLDSLRRFLDYCEKSFELFE